MTKIVHPTIPNIHLDVAAASVDDWLAMNWQLVNPPPKPESDPVPDQDPSRKAFPTPGDAFSVSKTLGGPRG